MKKTLIMFAIVLLSASVAHAQHHCQHAGNKADMAQKRTNDMVTLYGLNDKQAAQLLELNTEYADKMMPAGRPGQHHHAKAPHPQGKKDGHCDKAKDGQCAKAGEKAEKPCCKKGNAEGGDQAKPADNGDKPCCKKDQAGEKAEKPCCKKGNAEGGQKPEGCGNCKKHGQNPPEGHGKAMGKPAMSKEQAEQYRKEYDAKVKKIMTSKQYKQYKKDQKL